MDSRTSILRKVCKVTPFFPQKLDPYHSSVIIVFSVSDKHSDIENKVNGLSPRESVHVGDGRLSRLV